MNNTLNDKLIIDFDKSITKAEFKEIVDKICTKGVGQSAFQDYAKLITVLELFSKIEYAIGDLEKR